MDTDFDGAVRRVSTTYDGLGRRQLVTSYDDDTVGAPDTVVNEAKFTYDDWGPMSKLEEDRDSAVGASGSVNDYEISYTFEKATTGRNTVRRVTLATPSGNSITYDYTGGDYGDEASRVTDLKDGAVFLAHYDYNGVGQVVGTMLKESNVTWNQYGSSGTYPDLDRFNRVTSSRWTKELATDRDFVDLDVAYDRNSNITVVEDNVNTGMDAGYSIDNLNRLTQGKEGTWNSGTSQIDSMTREQVWTTLSQTGNWNRVKLNLNGDADYSDTGEYDDTRTHNDVNELTARDTDSNGTNNYTLTHDADGNLIDDGQNYEYVYDPFGRLRKVKNTSNQNLVEEYTYNGLGHRIGVHADTDHDSDVDSNDLWYYFAYDERWRIAGTFRSSDSSPKEDFIYHAAGADGSGGGSYIDAVVLRDKDANTSWFSASDGTLENRVYYCQNWRADVVAIVSVSGQRIEEAHYSSYGIPFGFPKGDVNNDGTVSTADTDQIQTWINASAYDVRGDMDRDGDVDATDKTRANDNIGAIIGWGALTDVGNRKGYAGYELDEALAGAQRVYHVRNRVLNADLGRWTRRDPLGYVEGVNLSAYVVSNPLRASDPLGTWFWFPWAPWVIGCRGLGQGCGTFQGPCCQGLSCYSGHCILGVMAQLYE